MYQAAKANKELSRILINMNPSFNLGIAEGSLSHFLSPSRHISPMDLVPVATPTDTDHTTPTGDLQPSNAMLETDEIPAGYDKEEDDELHPPAPEYLPVVLASTPTHPHRPPPLTADELLRKGRVIEAKGPSSLWQPCKSFC
eukprot:sb/3474170/